MSRYEELKNDLIELGESTDYFVEMPDFVEIMKKILDYVEYVRGQIPEAE